MRPVGRLVAAIAAAALLAGSAFAQNGTSVLSRYGIGDLQPLASTTARSLGGASSALVSPHDISFSNPALWALLRGLRLQGEISYEYAASSRAADLHAGSLQIKGFQFAIPLEEAYRTRLVAGFMPYSRVAYQARGRGDAGGAGYTADYLGSGGISLFRAGLAVAPFSFLRIGAAAEYYFGTISQDTKIHFDDASYVTTQYGTVTEHGGWGAVVGIHADATPALSIGASIETAASLHASRNRTYTFVTDDTYAPHDSIESDRSGVQDIPLAAAFGASYRVTDRLRVAAEYRVQDWTNAVVFDVTQPELRAASRIGIGLELQPDLEAFNAPFVDRAAWRIGVSRETGAVALPGTSADAFFLHAGMGLPIFSANRTDLAVTYGWIGSSGDPLGRRSIFRLSLSVSVGESYFIRKSPDE